MVGQPVFRYYADVESQQYMGERTFESCRYMGGRISPMVPNSASICWTALSLSPGACQYVGAGILVAPPESTSTWQTAEKLGILLLSPVSTWWETFEPAVHAGLNTHGGAAPPICKHDASI